MHIVLALVGLFVLVFVVKVIGSAADWLYRRGPR